MHDLVGLAPLEILLVLVAVNLVPGNNGTVLLVSVCFGFEQTEALEDNTDLGVVLIISEPLKWPRLRRVLLRGGHPGDVAAGQEGVRNRTNGGV